MQDTLGERKEICNISGADFTKEKLNLGISRFSYVTQLLTSKDLIGLFSFIIFGCRIETCSCF